MRCLSPFSWLATVYQLSVPRVGSEAQRPSGNLYALPSLHICLYWATVPLADQPDLCADHGSTVLTESLEVPNSSRSRATHDLPASRVLSMTSKHTFNQWEINMGVLADPCLLHPVTSSMRQPGLIQVTHTLVDTNLSSVVVAYHSSMSSLLGSLSSSMTFLADSFPATGSLLTLPLNASGISEGSRRPIWTSTLAWSQ